MTAVIVIAALAFVAYLAFMLTYRRPPRAGTFRYEAHQAHFEGPQEQELTR